MIKTYDDLVSFDRNTCQACPTQWEGVLRDGRSFYFRYRFGHATLAVGDDLYDVVGDAQVGMEIGDSLDGCLTSDEYRHALVELYNTLSME